MENTHRSDAAAPVGSGNWPTCYCCGGSIPPEGSEMYDHPVTEDGDCPGHLATDSRNQAVLICGAFDPDLDAREEENA